MKIYTASRRLSHTSISQIVMHWPATPSGQFRIDEAVAAKSVRIPDARRLAHKLLVRAQNDMLTALSLPPGAPGSIAAVGMRFISAQDGYYVTVQVMNDYFAGLAGDG